jgi:hypothetical protein
MKFKEGDRVRITIAEHETTGVIVIAKMETISQPYNVRPDSPQPWTNGDGAYWCFENEIESLGATSSGKPVDHFEVGKWYKWVGPKDTYSGDMGKILDGIPHCCELAGYDGRPDAAAFSGVPRISIGQGGQWCWFDSNMQYFREATDPSVRSHDSVSGLPRVGNCRCSLGEVITDKIVGKTPEFDPSSIKSRSQRRAEILHGLTID